MVQNVFGDDVALGRLVNRGHVVCPFHICVDKVVGSLVSNCV